MLRYTARNGTTFQFAPPTPAALASIPNPCIPGDCVQVIGTDQDGPTFELDLSDLREFLQYLEDQAAETGDEPTDGDLAAVGPD